MKPSEAQQHYRRLHDGSGRRNCPDADVMGRAAAHVLADAEHAAFVDHLAVCGECADEFRLLAPLKEWTEGASRALGRTTVASWRWLRPGFGVPHALAAGLMLFCLGLGSWGVGLRRQNLQLTEELQEARSAPVSQGQPVPADAVRLPPPVAAAPQPQLNVPIIDLEPRDATRGAATEPAEVLSAGGAVTLVLHVSSEPPNVDHVLEVLDTKGDVVWSGGGLRPNSNGTFTVFLPGGLLSAGQNRLRLLATQRSRRTLVHEYPLAVRRP